MDVRPWSCLDEQLLRIRPRLESLAKRSGQILFDTDDLIQEIFLIGIKRNLDWSVLTDGWFVVTAQNILRTAGRRGKRWQQYMAFRACEQVRTYATPYDQIQLDELRDDVHLQLKRLPSKERCEVNNRFFHGKAKAATANSTARTRLLRAKRRLRAIRRLQIHRQELGN